MGADAKRFDHRFKGDSPRGLRRKPTPEQEILPDG
jgi:hypothetical protein